MRDWLPSIVAIVVVVISSGVTIWQANRGWNRQRKLSEEEREARAGHDREMWRLAEAQRTYQSVVIAANDIVQRTRRYQFSFLFEQQPELGQRAQSHFSQARYGFMATFSELVIIAPPAVQAAAVKLVGLTEEMSPPEFGTPVFVSDQRMVGALLELVNACRADLGQSSSADAKMVDYVRHHEGAYWDDE